MQSPRQAFDDNGPTVMGIKTKKVTMHDVARQAGVSYQTVSRVLNNSCNVSQATRDKIEQAIKELKYVPNLLAQQLSKSERQVIGLINVSRGLQAPSDLVESIRHYARLQHYDLLMTLIDNISHDELSSCIANLKGQLISRILINVPLPNQLAERIVSDYPDLRFVFLDVDPFSPVLNVSFNPRDGTLASIEYLHSLGHKKTALIPGPRNMISSRLRYDSWIDGLRQTGMEVVDCENGDWYASSGFEAMTKILHRARGATAVLVGNDQMALGAISAIRQSGRRVPEDISVIGYDNTVDSEYFDPPLTTVGLDRDRQCRIAVDTILADPADAASSVLRTNLLIRQSCAPAAAASCRGPQLARMLRELAVQAEKL